MDYIFVCIQSQTKNYGPGIFYNAATGASIFLQR